MDSKIKVIIPAAGAGKRMRSYGPKGLIDICGKPLLKRQIDCIRNCIPNSEVTIVTGFEAHKIKQHIKTENVTFCFNEFYQDTNVAYSIYLAMRKVHDYDGILIVYGDLVFNEATLSNFDLSKSFVIVDNKKQMADEEVGVHINGEAIQQFTYNSDTKWAQIAYLQGEELDLFMYAMEEQSAERFFGFEILNYILDNEGQLTAVFKPEMKIAEIDYAKDIYKARDIYASASNSNNICP